MDAQLRQALLAKGMELIGPWVERHFGLPLLGSPDGGNPSAETAARKLSKKDVAFITVKRKDGSVSVIIGTRDLGKTEVAYRLAELLDRRTYCVSPEQRPPSWIEWVTLEDVPEAIEPWSTIIFDDLPAYASNRDYNTSLVQKIERMIPLCRHQKHLHLIFCTQSAAQADRYILDCELAFFKPVGLLMADIERPNIAQIYKRLVNPYFDGRSEWWIKRHVMMMSRGFIGGIPITRVPRNKAEADGAPAPPVVVRDSTPAVHVDVEAVQGDDDGIQITR